MPDSIFGFFCRPDAEAPTYDPGLNVPCPICLRPLSEPVKTVSVMPFGSDRSFFFRAHFDCWENASESDRTVIETAIRYAMAILTGKKK